MIYSQEGRKVVMPPAASATNATLSMSFDKVDAYGVPADHAQIDILVGAHATTTTVIETLKLSESDTLTSPSSMTDIVAFTGGTATSSSVGFVIPVVTTAGLGGGITFNVDLRKRKKYIGLSIAGTSATAVFGAVATLTRGKESADSATQKKGVNYGATSASSCMTVVNG
jgi:hypothetical protein